jgi:hypothetical protein
LTEMSIPGPWAVVDIYLAAPRPAR